MRSERRVGVEDLAGRRRSVEAHGHALEERAVAGLGLALDAAARGVRERRADRRDEAREVVGMLEDVVAEARLHGRDGELLAARGRAEDDGQVRVALADAAEDQESVDPARAVVRDDDVDVGPRLGRRELGGILDLDDLGFREGRCAGTPRSKPGPAGSRR